MSAEVFGTSLLQEVHEEPLSSLLSDLRTIHTPHPETTTGLAELDSVIEIFRNLSSEDVRGQIAPSNTDIPLDYELHDDDGYNDDTSPSRSHVQTIAKPRPVIINITQTSNSSTAATSLVLSYLTAHAILPPSYSGKHGAVVHIDCLNTFDTATLYSVTNSLIRKSIPKTPITTTNQLTRSNLSHVHIIRCSSTATLLQTLKDLPPYLLDSDIHTSSPRTLSLLTITGLNNHTWQDRFTTELTRLNQTNDYQPQDSLPTQILQELKSIQSTFDCTIVYTTAPSNVSHPPSENNDNNTTAISPPQDIYATSALLTLRAVRFDPPQFAPQMSLAECLRDREKRIDAVRNVRFWFSAVAGGLSERRGKERMGFGMRREGESWVFES